MRASKAGDAKAIQPFSLSRKSWLTTPGWPCPGWPASPADEPADDLLVGRRGTVPPVPDFGDQIVDDALDGAAVADLLQAFLFDQRLRVLGRSRPSARKRPWRAARKRPPRDQIDEPPRFLGGDRAIGDIQALGIEQPERLEITQLAAVLASRPLATVSKYSARRREATRTPAS